MRVASDRWPEILVVACIILVVSAVSFPLLDYAMATPTVEIVEVVEKHYFGVNQSSGIGVGAANGQTVVTTVNVSSDEKYILIVRKEGEVFSHEVDAATYANAVIGQDTQVKFRYGRFTGMRH
jgi:hypothetical protein